MINKIGVLTSGGDAPGMNAAIRAVVRTAIYHGVEVVGIQHGYHGLLNEEFREMDARSVGETLQKGGTILQTARCLEFKEWDGVLKGAEIAKKHGIDGLIVIGGDGSFRGARDLTRAGLPTIAMPGTIDNDIACSEYTVGFDTAMNTAIQMVDRIRDTAQSHDRCSVVEVMGRNAGYIALNAGIACGATYIITKEEPFTVNDVIAKIIEGQKSGKHHFIVIVAEGIGGSEQLAKEIEQATGVESRATILGHVQRGGSPTVQDRVVASQLGYYAVDLLSKGIGNRVVGLQHNEVVDYDIQEALKMKKEFPHDLYKIANEISF